MKGNMEHPLFKDALTDNVVADGLIFLQSLTNLYGADKGMEMWDKLGEVMGQEIKGRIFFSMLTGNNSSKIRLSVAPSKGVNKVALIKIIRVYTRLGLKDAKDISDLAEENIATIECSIGKRSEFLKELRMLGCQAS